MATLARSNLAHDDLSAWAIALRECAIALAVVGEIDYLHLTTRGAFTNNRSPSRLVKHYLCFDPLKSFDAYAAAQARNHRGKPGGGSNTRDDISKTAGPGRGTGRNVPSIRRDYNVKTNLNATTDAVANINHCLCTQTAPTSVVYS